MELSSKINLEEYINISNNFCEKIKKLSIELDKLNYKNYNTYPRYMEISDEIFQIYNEIKDTELYYYPITLWGNTKYLYSIIQSYDRLVSKLITKHQFWIIREMNNTTFKYPPKFSTRRMWRLWKTPSYIIAQPTKFNDIPKSDIELIKNLSRLYGDEDYVVTYFNDVLRIYIRYLSWAVTNKPYTFPVFTEDGEKLNSLSWQFGENIRDIILMVDRYLRKTDQLDYFLENYLYNDKIICSMINLSSYYSKLRRDCFGDRRKYYTNWQRGTLENHLDLGEIFLVTYYKHLPKKYKNTYGIYF